MEFKNSCENFLWRKNLKEVIYSNRMFQYEDMYSDFLCAGYKKLSENNLKIVIRSDVISEQTYWHIRYLRSMGIEPDYLLTTKVGKVVAKDIGVKMILVDDIRKMDTSKMMLLIVNRESDFGLQTQEDYRESDFNFIIRKRAQIAFERQRSIFF